MLAPSYTVLDTIGACLSGRHLNLVIDLKMRDRRILHISVIL